MAFIAVAGASLFGGGAFGSLAFNAVLGAGMLGLSYYLQSRQKITGPRLDDTKVSGQPVGSPIPLHHGTNVVGFIAIWIKDNKLIERSKTERQGKGGPKVTTYTYYVTGAWAICDNEIVGIQKMWINDKLVVNRVDTDKIVKVKNIKYNLYRGSLAQMPDPVMEASIGVGLTPAYRGLSYIVFDELPLEEFGNMIPTIRAQIPAVGSINITHIDIASNTLGGDNGSNVDIDRNEIWVCDANTIGDQISDLRCINARTGAVIRRRDIPISEFRADNNVVPDQGSNIWIGNDFVDRGLIRILDKDSLAVKATFFANSASGATCHYHPKSDGTGGWMHIYSSSVHHIKWLPKGYSASGNVLPDITSTLPGVGRHTFKDDGTFYGADFFSPTVKRFIPNTLTGSLSLSMTKNLSAVVSSILYFGYYPDQDCIVVVGPYTPDNTKTFIGKYTSDTSMNLIESDLIDFKIESAGSSAADPALSIQYGLIFFAKVTIGPVYEYDLSIMDFAADTTGVTGISTPSAHQYIPQLDATSSWNGGPHNIIFWNRISGQQVSVGEVIADISSRVGMPSGRYDVSGIMDVMIDGYTIAEQVAASDPINDMMTVCSIEVADQGSKNTFFKRGIQTPVYISSGELAASEGGEIDDVDLKIEIAEGISLPKVMHIEYPDPAAKYEKSNQTVFRQSQVVASVDEATLTTRVVMSADVAAQRLEILFRSIWRARTSYEMMLPPSYKRRAPGDVLMVPHNGSYHQVMIQSITFDDGPIIVKGVYDDISQYTSDAVGLPTKVSDDIIGNLADTALFLMDVNALRDEDVNNMFYIGAYKTNPYDSWNGAEIFKGATQTSMSDWTAVNNEVAYGHILDPLLPIAYPELVDTNAYVIYIPEYFNFAWSSVTVEDLWEDVTLNAFMVLTTVDGEQEAEYCQAATVTYLGSNQWQFSDLIRGLRGTEFAVPHHVMGESAIFPTTTTLYREGDTTDVNNARSIQAVTFGNAIPATSPIYTFTNKAKALRPYSPAHLSSTRDPATSDCLIDWFRRAKTGGAWVEGVDVPLDENVEMYRLRIYTDATKTTMLREQVISGTSEYLYLLADYNTDPGGGGGAAIDIPAIYVYVQQWGSSYNGYGIAAEGYI